MPLERQTKEVTERIWDPTETRNQLPFRSDTDDSAHLQISSSRAHVEVDCKRKKNCTFWKSRFIFKSNDWTKRIKISENEEYPQIIKN